MGASTESLWLVLNPSSGSNDRATVETLREKLRSTGYSIQRESCFPEEPLPSVAEMDQSRIELVAIFTGDGSINALVEHLDGWHGSILVLPGGTMNLLARRLHGDLDMPAIIDRLGDPGTRAIRPTVIETCAGTGLSGVLVGPGAVWSEVREAMRDGDIAAMATGAAHAIGQTTAGPRVRAAEPAVGRDEGYPLLLLSPEPQGIGLAGYFADDMADYLRQATAIAARDFRHGPHEDLGTHGRLVIANLDGDPIQLLVDGEPHEGSAREVFTLAECGVDLIATAP